MHATAVWLLSRLFARFQVSVVPAFSCCCCAARDAAMDSVEGKILAIFLVKFVSVQEN